MKLNGFLLSGCQVLASFAACADAQEVKPPQHVAAPDLKVGQSASMQKLAAEAPVRLEFLGRFDSEIRDQSAAEIVDYCSQSKRLFVTNSAGTCVDVLDIRQPGQPFKLGSIPLRSYGGGVNSLAVKNGVVAVAIEAKDSLAPGRVGFFQTSVKAENGGEIDASLSIDQTPIAIVQVGVMPDMLTFSPDGNWVVVANEAEPSNSYKHDPEGTVAIIDCSGGIENITQADVRLATFTHLKRADLDPRIRIFGPGSSVAQDLEPEYVAISRDSKTAYVVMQENNAIAVIDIASAKLQSIFALGTRDASLPGKGLDPSDRDGGVHIGPHPVQLLYQPDGMVSFDHQGATYLVTANEGDAREYKGLDESRKGYGRLKVSKVPLPPLPMGSSAATGPHAFGSRSFSIWTADGTQVFDSGEDFERITAEVNGAEFFNRGSARAPKENRSTFKGPEPEAVTVGMVGDLRLAFIGLERAGGVMVYDITVPQKSKFLQYINTQNFRGVLADGTAGDVAPEGIKYIPAEQSPAGIALLVVANEVSGTVVIYQLVSNVN